VGLLCRKANGFGFCSDEDVRQRKRALGRPAGPRVEM
jgi:hypothetical protein